MLQLEDCPAVMELNIEFWKYLMVKEEPECLWHNQWFVLFGFCLFVLLLVVFCCFVLGGLGGRRVLVGLCISLKKKHLTGTVPTVNFPTL